MKLKTSELLFRKLCEIKDEINKQIPLASNRYEEYECAPADADPAEIDKKYFIHDQATSSRYVEYYVFDHIKEKLEKLLSENNIIYSELNATELKQFKEKILQSTNSLFDKIKRTAKYTKLGDNFVEENATEIHQYMIHNLDEIIQRILNQDELSPDHQDFNIRHKKNLKVLEHREINHRQFKSIVLQNSELISCKESYLKIDSFVRGLYQDRVKSDVGFCDEHTALGLINIYEHYLVDSAVNVEKIYITYLEDDGTENDGHTFLAINRDPKSKLNDILSWGKEAVLFDPWNKLVCWAEQFESLPYRYFSFPPGIVYEGKEHCAKWSSILFSDADYKLLRNLRSQNAFFTITGYADLEKREQALKEEFCLTSLQGKVFENLKGIIETIADDVKPDNFNMKVEFLITTRGNQFVKPLPGFSSPKIAIHKDFLMGIRKGGEGQYTLEEMRFGLACALQYIKHNPFNFLECKGTDKYDAEALGKSQNGAAAISFLQKSIEFEKNCQYQHDFSLSGGSENYVEIDNALRIKFISAKLAENDQIRNNTKSLVINEELFKEVSLITAQDFFNSSAFNACPDIPAKINYLKTCLPALHNELIPYELTEYASIRLIQFCYLIRTITIDFKDHHHVIAVDELINSAFEQEIPGFEQIYFAIVNTSLKKLKESKKNNQLPPLGIFKSLQQAITQFVVSTDYQNALSAAELILHYTSKLKYHFTYNYLGNYFNEKTLIEHGKRIFISHVGHYIDWQGFKFHPIKILNCMPNEVTPNSYVFINNPQNYALIYINEHKQLCPIDINLIEDLKDTLKKRTEINHYQLKHLIKKSIAEYILNSLPKLPWGQHLIWMKNDASKSIANALWHIGVVRDKRLWEIFSYDEIRNKILQPHNYNDVKSESYNEKYIYPLIKLSGELHSLGDCGGYYATSDEFETYLAEKHQLKTDMFNDSGKFEQAFINFYDANLPVLINPGDYFNDDNEAVKFLLGKFLEVVQQGRDEEKNVVKSFFMGREDKRDLRHLSGFTNNHHMLSTFSHYVEFFLLQRFRKNIFSVTLLKKLFEDKKTITSLQEANDKRSKALLEDIQNNKFTAVQRKFKDLEFKYVVKPYKKRLFYLSLLPRFNAKATHFSLFSAEEILELYEKHHFAKFEITALHYISMFNLAYPTITLECLKELVSKLQKVSMNREISKAIRYHLKYVATYQMLSHETASICEFLVQSLSHPFFTSQRNIILKSLQGSIPLSLKNIPDISCNDLIIIYRTYDQYFQFRSLEQQQLLGNLILEKVDSLKSVDEQNECLEKLTFTRGTEFKLSLNDIHFRNKVVKMLIRNILSQHGKNKNQYQDDYHTTMKALISRIYDHTEHRDAFFILSELGNAIEAQWELSQYMGMYIEPEKFLVDKDIQRKFSRKEDEKERFIGFVGALGKEKEDRLQILNFLSSPVNQSSLQQFAQYLMAHDKVKKLSILFGDQDGIILDQEGVENVLQLVYQQFWLSSVRQRAVIIDYLLIPADSVVNEEITKQAYDEAFIYVTKKLFPSAYSVEEQDENENFAVSFLKAYLDSADKYLRNYLLAAMLVANNQFDDTKKTNVGKKLAVLCEYLGPAYVKLAQAIHSYPATPESIRQDLDKVKSKANPPTRWDLWRMIHEVLPVDDFNKIRRVGAVLGSASFNIAAAVEYNDKNAVLLLLRENAKKETEEGFSHLRKAVQICDHKKINIIRHDAISLIKESEELSFFEMDQKSGDIQGKIAKQIYNSLLEVKLGDTKYQILTFPSTTLKSGSGYRFITRVYGTEFNDLPMNTAQEIATKKMVAKAIMTLELSNILHGQFFDCDRHGNQLQIRVNQSTRTIEVGLYDFGEMALEKPTVNDLKQLATFVSAIPELIIKRDSLVQSFSNYMRNLHEYGQSTKYLMRIRKGLLALQDFQKHLNENELYEILKFMPFNSEIHPLVKTAYMKSLISISFKDIVSHMQIGIAEFFTPAYRVLSLFQTKKDESSGNHIEMKQLVVNPKNESKNDCDQAKTEANYPRISPILCLKRFHEDEDEKKENGSLFNFKRFKFK